MLKLIKGGKVYAPQNLGEMDILMGGTKVLAVAPNIDLPANIESTVFDATGKTVIPGLIDSHVHLIGAGGGEGPTSRTHEVDVTTIAKAGLTTVVGTLGIDTVSFGLRHLLVTTYALEKLGISTYMYTGGYQLPAVTITDSVLADLTLINKIVGVKIALFDSLCSHPSKEVLAQLATKVMLGGRLGGKAGVIHAHIGDTQGSFVELAEMLKYMGLPASMLVTTHINRSADVIGRAIEGGLAGLSLDITALYTPDNNMPQTIGTAKALRMLLDAGIPLQSITISSDSNAAYPFVNAEGKMENIMLTPVNMIMVELRKAVLKEGWALEDILPIATSNAARRLKIDTCKGTLERGKDADVVILDKDMNVETVIARGKLLLEDKTPVTVGCFENDYRNI
jgi:beta-aspartyl-dipeptidase (metallo-type)